MKSSQLPKISIVTPSLNQGRFIEKTIRSVLMQDYPNLEYIVIDGGSTDNTIDIIKNYEDNITYWVSEKDSGQASAINKGLEKCSGQVFNWINSDDYYEPQALLKVGKAFIDDGIDILVAKERHFDKDGYSCIRSGSTIDSNIENTIFKGHIDQPSTFWRLSVIHEIGILNEEFSYLMDAELWMRYLMRKGYKRISKEDSIVVNFRLHASSKTSLYSRGFEDERWSLRYNLSKNIVGLEELTRVFNKLNFPKIKVDWVINYKINRNFFVELLSSELIKEFYSRRQYDEAKIVLMILIKSGLRYIFINIMYVIKIYFIPKNLLNVFRSKNNIE